jgi:kanamycin kinase
MSLDWNFGKGHQPEFFDAYGITPDEDRIRYYRALWHLES